MTTINPQLPDENAVGWIKSAANHGVWEGKEHTAYFMTCSWYWPKYECTIIFTRDINHHHGGWWKNPQYEQCYHLSICFQGPDGVGAKDLKLTLKVLDLLFGKDATKVWSEPPYGDEGKRKDIWHYRLFCDKNWEPFVPKGEVYSTELTERGWLSHSEIKYQMEQE